MNCYLLSRLLPVIQTNLIDLSYKINILTKGKSFAVSFKDAEELWEDGKMVVGVANAMRLPSTFVWTFGCLKHLMSFLQIVWWPVRFRVPPFWQVPSYDSTGSLQLAYFRFWPMPAGQPLKNPTTKETEKLSSATFKQLLISHIQV